MINIDYVYLLICHIIPKQYFLDKNLSDYKK